MCFLFLGISCQKWKGSRSPFFIEFSTFMAGYYFVSRTAPPTCNTGDGTTLRDLLALQE